MKVLFISTETRPMIGGIANCLDSWMSGLVENDVEVHSFGLLSDSFQKQVSTLMPRKYREEWLFFDRKTHFGDNFWITRKIWSMIFIIHRNTLIMRTFQRLVEEIQPDQIVFSVLNPVCCMPLNYALQKGLKCLAIAYGSEINPIRVSDPVWLRDTLSKIPNFIAISKYTKDLLINEWGVAPTRINIVHPSLSPDFENRYISEIEQSTSSNTFRVLTICRLVERKGVQFVLEAIKILKSQGFDLQYDVVGNGPYMESLVELSKKLEIEDVVKFWGSVNNDKRSELLASCDVFVLTPFEDDHGDVEGFGIVYLEAGWFGKPVIGSWSGGVPDAVFHSETGFLIQPMDIDGLVSCLNRLYCSPSLRKVLGKRNQIWANGHKNRNNDLVELFTKCS